MDKNKVLQISKQIGIDWNKTTFTIDDLIKGMNVELEHGTKDPQTNVTNDDPLMTAKIALAHLKEDPKYYEKLEKVENDSSFVSENFLRNIK